MESEEDKIELIQIAIQQLMEEEKTDYNKDQTLLLSRLLAQLETFKVDNELLQPEPSSDPIGVAFPADGILGTETGPSEEVDGGSIEVGRDEIVKELREVKRQNFVTHCLLSAVIFLTLAWQISEFSLILKVKNGLTNPFGFVGGMLTGFLKRPGKNDQDGEKQSSSTQKHTEAPALPVKISELPHIIQGLGLDGDDE
ncbi:uncharacterized protein LOC132303420 [Cornus florida]|uniref:uncharacterized protein LOC132303420 n=1 Tax=Cornus florida TaxID=4283 RepID=UPI0028966E49|nr:uncharacterized protein LOC132303420 [Cornus florida]